jgi:hypothetical protein
MKKLALLFLVLPVPALASQSLDQVRMQQASEARTYCMGRNIGQQSPHYAGCVNDYLQSRYGWRVLASRDGSLQAVPAEQMPTARGNETNNYMGIPRP